MKVCKKCKTHVANKAKICKNCGADVSKAKIIKNTAPTNNKKTVKPKTDNKSKEKEVKQEVSEIKSESVTRTENIMISRVKKIKTLKKNDLNNAKNNVKETIIKLKNVLLQILKTIYEFLKKTIIVIGTKLVFISKKIFYGVKIVVLQGVKGLKELFKLLVKACKSLKNKAIIISKKIIEFLKTKYFNLKTIIKERKVKRKEKKLEKEKLVEQRREERIEARKEKLEKIEQKKKEREINKEKTENKPDRVKVINKKRRRIFKIATICLILISMITAGCVYGKALYEDLTGKPINFSSSKKATTDKVFSMNDVISYKNVDYKVVKVETSQGNAYKSPKDGNQFLIVTVYIKNNSKEKKNYSYQNWTMSNSKGEEKTRIFTSINVDTALYSGELVVGGVKSGSMVFEQPIDDPKLVMNFYQLKKDDEGYNVADLSKRVFSVGVKISGSSSVVEANDKKATGVEKTTQSKELKDKANDNKNSEKSKG